MLDMTKEMLVDLYPEIFIMKHGNLFMRNSKLYSGEVRVAFMNDNIDLCMRVSPNDLNRHQIQHRHNDDPFDNLQITIRFDKVTRKESSRYGLMDLLYYVEMTDAECMAFFSHGITIKYPDYIFDEEQNTIGVDHMFYEKEIITRRHTINEIINHG